jgi:hypothetical protein
MKITRIAMRIHGMTHAVAEAVVVPPPDLTLRLAVKRRNASLLGNLYVRVTELCGNNEGKIRGGTVVAEPNNGETLSLAVGFNI